MSKKIHINLENWHFSFSLDLHTSLCPTSVHSNPALSHCCTSNIWSSPHFSGCHGPPCTFPLHHSQDNSFVFCPFIFAIESSWIDCSPRPHSYGDHPPTFNVLVHNQTLQETCPDSSHRKIIAPFPESSKYYFSTSLIALITFN